MSVESAKMFIGGIHPRTTSETLVEFFSKYGEVIECRVPMKDYMPESRGFAFLTFKELGALQAAVTDGAQMIEGRRVETRIAGPKTPRQTDKNGTPERSNRVFVGGVRDHHNYQVLRNFFGEFGAVESVECFADRNTGKCRGFAFVVFKDCDTADKLIQQRVFKIDGHQVEVKSANRAPQRNQTDRDRECRNFRQRNNIERESRMNPDGSFSFDIGHSADKSGSRVSREEEYMPQFFLPPPAWGSGVSWAPQFALPSVYPPMPPSMMQSYGMMPFPDVMAPPPYWIEGDHQPAYHIPQISQEFTGEAFYEPYYASS